MRLQKTIVAGDVAMRVVRNADDIDGVGRRQPAFAFEVCTTATLGTDFASLVRLLNLPPDPQYTVDWERAAIMVGKKRVTCFVMNDQTGVNAAPVEREAALGPFAAQILIMALGHTPDSGLHCAIAKMACASSPIAEFRESRNMFDTLSDIDDGTPAI